jgi:predicted TPR repeat methyltransferase
MRAQRPSISPTLRITLVDDGMIAYDTATDALHHLNATAAFMLTVCDGQHAVEEIKAAVVHGVTHGHQPGVKAVALDGWFDTAVKDGLIVFGPPATSMLREMEADELVQLATRLGEDGETAKAYQCQRRATELDPARAEWWYDLGTLAQLAGDRAGACAAYERYLALTPDDATVAHLLRALSGGPPPARASDACIVQMFERFSASYDHHMRDALGYCAPATLLAALSLVLPSTRPTLEVLDLGCGTGLAGEVFQPWARWLEGVDLSPDMAAHARARDVYDAVHVAELSAWLSAARRSYDVIVACDVFVYFGELTGVLKAACRVLAPGGWMGFTIERSTAEPWLLTDSGRYAHGAAYIRTAAEVAGFKVVHLAEQVIRTEFGAPVVGLITVLQRNER